jgi:hypothetical protein
MPELLFLPLLCLRINNKTDTVQRPAPEWEQK